MPFNLPESGRRPRVMPDRDGYLWLVP